MLTIRCCEYFEYYQDCSYCIGNILFLHTLCNKIVAIDYMLLGTHTTKRDSNITPQSESQSQGTADMSPLPAPPSVPGPTTASHLSIFSTSVLNQSMREQLVQARDILEQGLQYVSYARRATARTDGKSIADISWVKVNITSKHKTFTC